jgi:DNA-binding response OmpR family regulator
MKVLLVEDEAKMARLLQRGLTEEGHLVDHCGEGLAALEQARTVDYDVIVLDWSLPDLDGLSVLRRWREQGLRTPVLMLTARGTTGEKVSGLRAGADDYLTKPFDFEELLARLEALGRRSGGGARLRTIGPITFDSHKRALVHGDVEATLTAREYQLFCQLADHVGEVVTRAELLAAVWGANFDGNPNVVDVYVSYLRGKLRMLGELPIGISAVRGLGYRLEAEAQPDSKADPK